MDGLVKIDTGQDGRSWQAFRERKSAFNSCIGRVVANSRQKMFLRVLLDLQQKAYLQIDGTIVFDVLEC